MKSSGVTEFGLPEGASGWPFLHRMLKNPSPTVAPDVTEREKRGRFTHLQRKLSTEKVFGMRHRF